MLLYKTWNLARSFIYINQFHAHTIYEQLYIIYRQHILHYIANSILCLRKSFGKIYHSAIIIHKKKAQAKAMNYYYYIFINRTNV